MFCETGMLRSVPAILILKEELVRSCIMFPEDEGVDDTEGALKREIKVDVPPESISWSKLGL
jgi:hypothetical protein